MRNFDYLKDIELTDLHRFCSAAEENQVCNPDISAMCARKAIGVYGTLALQDEEHRGG